MAFQIINSIISWFLKKRKHQIELFLKYPIDVQNELLLDLVNTSKNTEIGKKNGFASIKNYRDFAEKVPIQKYETFEPLIERCRMGEQNIFWPSDIKWFAKSSGTTNAKSKFIPVSDDALEYCHMKAGKDMLCWYINNNPKTQLFTGKGLRLGGSSDVYRDNNSYFGDLSAIIIENMPFWADFSSAPSQEVALMGEWETKMDAIIDETIHENITSLAGVPSWMLVLLNRILERTGKDNILEVWPNLEVYFHGGVNFNPYREQYKKIIPKATFKYYEIYNASEGFFAIQDRNHSKELLLMLDYGIFYEFIPMENYDEENSIAIPLSEVKKDVNYAIVITTNGGLWRYLIGDTVKFTSINPYRIKITGRTKHHINVFGEELIIENAEEALKLACEKTEATIKDYTVGPIFMDGKEKGGHEWIIEFEKSPKNVSFFTEMLDNALKAINSDYEAKRYQNMTLTAPKVHVANEGLFYSWLKKKGKLGGQHKVPRLSNSREFIEELLAL
ncbi:GH3 auxin-responsive promoter family protein [Polaribacter aestuariivivens]|uniref:GH3 auxin-responsive promoter family protein n=1 Tax=Polaribacter aestuariivivens TaxID=2304626 RepID=A0A5S3NAF1_9FLAO|nr:GH3 auxin-responsive promoter family protein [Polaribacter aestuariivivens]TMM32250.1 GH3 auxin-responsive promoter family protein [Polaribacter aestuariivivens]